MKQRFLLKSMFLLFALIVGSLNLWGQAEVGTTLWAETWTGASTGTSANDSYTPSANYGKGTTVYDNGTVSYTQSANSVYVRNENLAGGSKPELLLAENKTWTISNIPTGQASELTLTYKSNNTKSSVTCSTSGVTITGSSKSYTITTNGAETITLVFGCSGNTRIDDVSLTVKTAGNVTKVATPKITPSTGTYNNDQSVTISCGTTGATIYYTTDGSAPTSSSTEYTGAITVNASQTIKAIGIKSGLTSSDVAEATYTMQVSDPTISPSAGTYNNNQSVTLSCGTTGATIRYTTDGSTPTESSTAYSEAITVSSSQTIKAKAFKTGYTASGEVSAAYVMTVANPTFTVSAGTYSEAKSVELNCTTTGAAIRYTTNGDEPTSSSTLYEGAISVNRTMTIKAKAFKTGYTASGEVSAAYTLKCATPTISKTDGDFVTTKEITMTSTDGATIYYTTDGTTDPTTSSTVYDPENKPVISATTTFKAIAVIDGWTNSDVKTQTYTKQEVLEGLSALVAQTNTSWAYKYVNLTDAQVTWTNGTQIGYMEDGNRGVYWSGTSSINTTTMHYKPTLNNVYNGIFKIRYQLNSNMPQIQTVENVEGTITGGSDIAAEVMTPSALEGAFDANLGKKIQINSFKVPTGKKLTDNINLYDKTSNTSYAATTVGTTYNLIGYPFKNGTTKQFRVTVANEKPEAPTFNPMAGAFYDAFTLHLACATTDVTIYYTTDGNDPTTSSTEYADVTGIAIPAATTTVKAIAVKAGMVSDVATATYTYYSVKQPAFGTASGTAVYYNDKVTVTCETANSDIFYTLTTDGSEPADPTSASAAYPDGGIAITANTVKIKVIGKNGENYSPVAEATYTLKDPEAPTFEPAAGAVERGTTVTISSREGTTIFYTTNGADADKGTDAESNSINITITEAMTLKAIAVDPELNFSSESSAAYTIVKVATPTFSVAAGKIAQGSTVTLSCETEDASIYYTTDGTTPTTSSTLYSTAITVSADMTIKAIAVKANCDDSDVASAAYTVVVPVYGYNIDFEVDELSQYVNWTFTNIAKHTTTIDAHAGSYYGSNVNSEDNATTSAIIKTNNKVAHPGTLEFYISKESKNTTASSWYVEVSTNGTEWEQIGDAQDATVGSKGDWTKVTRNLSSKSNVFVRIRYGGTNAIRAIDDITLTEAAVDVTIGASGYGTYCSTYALDYSKTDVKVYIAKVEDEKVKMTEITDGIVPANTGVILTGTAGTYAVALAANNVSPTADFTDNEMVGVTQRTQVLWNPSTGVYNYILQNQGDGAKFYKATGGYLKANRAYLSTSYDVSAQGAPALSIVIDEGETTSMSLTSTLSEGEGAWYDLSGRKLQSKPTAKGIYIMNGKKIAIK